MYCISIHALRVEGDRSQRRPELPRGWISIHALRVEGDEGNDLGYQYVIEFLSTPSGWRATRGPPPLTVMGQFLSTPSGWRATDFGRPGGHRRVISIHALRVEGDLLHIDDEDVVALFLSTPSGWRATRIIGIGVDYGQQFLSTPSGWRAT